MFSLDAMTRHWNDCFKFTDHFSLPCVSGIKIKYIMTQQPQQCRLIDVGSTCMFIRVHYMY